ncbi:META domain-containing protein [Neisseria chenwenguii]|uniref:Uncharacterized protein n=1 Tax=Neisseria chenwenguii TaxID=1853278 RepID=A0A220S0J5_9NEIS|nr:META domain-containing protein [Neisseria chenwenguii]ASK26967.1 hypothetical protein BG910_03735 [Neisseria chenwenguii]ROV56131.1 META domain-containing protein [Neisseria chenwenguii]
MKKIAILFPLILSACFPIVYPSKVQGNHAPEFQGAWRVNAIGGSLPTDPNAVFTINTTDKGFKAVSECNKVFGEYAAEGKNLTFGVLTTQGVCKDKMLEKNFAGLFQSVRSYRLRDGRLDLLDDQGSVVIQGKRLSNERPMSRSAAGEPFYLADARRN